MLCKGVGVGITLNPESGQAGVMLSLHDEEGNDDNPESFIILTAERAVEVAMGLMARGSEVHKMVEEIMNTPMDDRPAAIARVVDRLHGSAN